MEAANERFTLVVESMASAIAVLAEPNRDVLFFANRSYRTLLMIDPTVRQNSLPAWKRRLPRYKATVFSTKKHQGGLMFVRSALFGRAAKPLSW